MGIFIYYHLTLLNNWREIVREQCTRIIFSGLYGDTTMIKCYAITPNPDTKLIEECRKRLKSYGEKFELRDHTAEGNEWFTLSHMREITDDDDYVLYIHTKGVTRFGTTLYTFKGDTYNIPDIYDNILDWRDLMEYFLIARYKRCIEELENGYDTIGINLFTGTPLHYAGNFFWLKGSYIKSLDYTKEHNPETWIFDKPNSFNLSMYQSKQPDIPFGFYGIGHYFMKYPMCNVTDKYFCYCKSYENYKLECESCGCGELPDGGGGELTGGGGELTCGGGCCDCKDGYCVNSLQYQNCTKGNRSLSI